MNRLKVNIAKEKISRLREKYSKNANQEEDNSSLESLISIQSEKKSDQERNKHSQQQNIIFEKQVWPNANDNFPTGKGENGLLIEETEEKDIFKDDLDLHINISHESKFDIAEQVFEQPLSSAGSLVLSDLSNQFERIHFISSSSEDLSIVESESAQSKSLTINVPSLVEISAKSKDTSNEEKGSFKTREHSETFDTIFKKNSVKSVSGLESSDLSKISSIKELISSELETENTLNKTSFVDSNTDTRIHDKVKLTSPQQNNKIDGLSINLSSSSTDISEKMSSLHGSTSEVREKDTKTDEESDICISFKLDCKHNKPKGKCERSFPVDHKSSTQKLYNTQSATDKFSKCRSYVNKCLNTDPVKVTYLKNRSKHHQHKPESYIKRSIGKLEKDEHNKHCNKQVFHTNKKTKRLFIKPCELINQEEIKNIESKSKIYQVSPSLKFSWTSDLYYLPTSAATPGITCDEVISLLLKNQIQLTRHFMESHQRMYLQVCQAAQLLNENHSTI